MAKRYDVIIAGGGDVGLALAAAIRSGSPSLAVALFEAPHRPSRPAPALALAPGSRRCLAAIGAWAELADGAEPIRAMAISDSRLEDAVRPVFLRFDETPEPGEPLAHMVAAGALGAALRRRTAALGVDLVPTRLAGFAASTGAVEARTAAGEAVSAGLVVAADGAASPLRRAARIPIIERDYRRAAIVATIGHARDHHGEARQHFLPGGPFAALPLRGRRSAIVWTEPTRTAKRLAALPPDSFLEALAPRFGRELGELTLIDGPDLHPLKLLLARRFTDERFALVGDAAHVTHPLAGQGFNLGLRDAAALAEAVVDAARLGLDVGALEVLDRYQRMRRFDVVATTLFADGLERLFAAAPTPLRLARDLGLGLADRAPPLKRFFAAEAAGRIGRAPRLLRGESL